jgi:hypothetical protein
MTHNPVFPWETASLLTNHLIFNLPGRTGAPQKLTSNLHSDWKMSAKTCGRYKPSWCSPEIRNGGSRRVKSADTCMKLYASACKLHTLAACCASVQLLPGQSGVENHHAHPVGTKYSSSVIFEFVQGSAETRTPRGEGQEPCAHSPVQASLHRRLHLLLRHAWNGNGFHGAS